MKKLLILSLITSFSSVAFSASHTLTFSIKEVKTDKGQIMIQLFKGEKNYSESVAIDARAVPAKKGEVVVSFPQLESGEYAIRYFHDENNNNEIDSNLLRIPTEGYGFSNEAKGKFGPPSYEEMKITIKSDYHDHSTITY